MKNKLELTWVNKDKIPNIEPRILIENKKNSYGDLNNENLLIHGDNLLALKALEKKFSQQIKCIYIDPPYNTGSAFEYYDDKLEHSLWLSLMRDRLNLLRELLAPDGIIFIHIDDNEGAYLKVLCDQIFHRHNYLNTISVKMKNIAGASGGGEDKRLKKNIEYILVYTKNYQEFKWLQNAYSYTEISELINKYKENGISWKYTSILYDKGKEEYLCSTYDANGNEIKIYNRHDPQFLSIKQVAELENLSEKEVYYKYMDRIHTTAMPQSSIRPRVIEKLKDLSHTEVISIKYTPKTGKNKGKEYEQFYKGDKFRLLTWLKDVTEWKNDCWMKKDLQGTLWDGINLNNLTKEGQVEFPNGKKPELLISRIIEMTTKEGDYVLDSFLGSGTTCAVAHKMKRKWIGIEMGDHIFSHCIPRLNRIIDGQDKNGITKDVNWQGGGGYKFYELAPSLIQKDSFGEEIINQQYDQEMLAKAVALHEGFTYQPNKDCFWKQSIGSEQSYLYVTNKFIDKRIIENIQREMKEEEYLVIACTAYEKDSSNLFKNIQIKKIPETILQNCDYEKDNYNLNVENPLEYEEYMEVSHD